MSVFLKSITKIIFLTLTCQVSLAQDYPYEDEVTEYIPQLRQKKELDPKYQLPIERPKKQKPLSHSLFGLNLQGGSTFALNQDAPDTLNNSTTGWGYALALGFHWDMLNAPISLELETGFQNNLRGTYLEYYEVPVKLTTYYWSKISNDSVFRIGIGSNLGLQILPATPTEIRMTQIRPAWTMSAMYEYSSFTVEPVLQILRLKNSNSFIAGAIFFGYRI